MEKLLKQISRADGIEIEKILHTAVQRYRFLFPESEIIFLSLPKNDPEERKRTIEYVMRMEKVRNT